MEGFLCVLKHPLMLWAWLPLPIPRYLLSSQPAQCVNMRLFSSECLSLVPGRYLCIILSCLQSLLEPGNACLGDMGSLVPL